MDPLSSSSGDAFDSMGFNDFMNAQGSSDEEKTVARLPGRRNAGVFGNAKHGDMYGGGLTGANAYSSYGSAANDPYAFGTGGGALGGDPYSFNFDFSSVKAPPKKLPEPAKNEPSKSSLRSSKDSAKKEVSFENPDSLTSILTSARPVPSKPSALVAESVSDPKPTAQSKFAALACKEEIQVLAEEEEESSGRRLH